jgi:hypothetical protein
MNGVKYEVIVMEDSPFLNPSILLRILLSKTLNLHSSFNVRNLLSQPYSTTGNNIVLYVLILKFLEIEQTKVFGLINNEFLALYLHFYFLLNRILFCH